MSNCVSASNSLSEGLNNLLLIIILAVLLRTWFIGLSDSYFSELIDEDSIKSKLFGYFLIALPGTGFFIYRYIKDLNGKPLADCSININFIVIICCFVVPAIICLIIDLLIDKHIPEVDGCLSSLPFLFSTFMKMIISSVILVLIIGI